MGLRSWPHLTSPSSCSDIHSSRIVDNRLITVRLGTNRSRLSPWNPRQGILLILCFPIPCSSGCLFSRKFGATEKIRQSNIKNSAMTEWVSQNFPLKYLRLLDFSAYDCTLAVFIFSFPCLLSSPILTYALIRLGLNLFTIFFETFFSNTWGIGIYPSARFICLLTARVSVNVTAQLDAALLKFPLCIKEKPTLATDAGIDGVGRSRRAGSSSRARLEVAARRVEGVRDWPHGAVGAHSQVEVGGTLLPSLLLEHLQTDGIFPIVWHSWTHVDIQTFEWEYLSASAPHPFQGEVTSLTSRMGLLGFPCQCYCDTAARCNWHHCDLKACILFPSATDAELPAIKGRRTIGLNLCLGLECLVNFLSNSNIPVISVPETRRTWMKAMWHSWVNHLYR